MKKLFDAPHVFSKEWDCQKMMKFDLGPPLDVFL